MILGAVIALGTTLLYPFAIGIILYYVLLRHKSLPRLRIPFSLWLIIAIVSISVLWNPKSGEPLLWGVNALSVYLAGRYLLPNQFTKYPILITALCAVSISVYEYSQGIIRVRGLSENASLLGIAGVSLFPSIAGAALSGISISRTALAAWVLLAISNPIRKTLIAVGIVLALNVGITMLVAPQRYTFKVLNRDNDLRITAIQGTSLETPPPSVTPPPVKTRTWEWYGYGYGAYTEATGRIQPHNVFVRSWWELGIFSIPFWGYLSHLWWQLPGKHNFYIPLVILTAGMLTDEFYGSMEGSWMLLALWHGTKGLPHPFTWLLKFGRMVRQRQRIAAH